MEADERKRKSGTDPGGEIQKGSTCGTAVGAKQGRTKGNEQELSKQNRMKRTGNRAWKKGKKRRGRKEPSLDGSRCEANGQRAERKKQKLSSWKRNRRGRKEPEGKRKTWKAKAGSEHLRNGRGSESGKSERKHTAKLST